MSSNKTARAIYSLAQITTYSTLTWMWVIFLLNLIDWFGLVVGVIVSLFVPLMVVYPFYHWYRDGHLPWTFLAIFGVTLVFAAVGSLVQRRVKDS